MFIGHFPANYLAACALESTAPAALAKPIRGLAFRLFVLAGIVPDLDMLYFYLVDGRSRHHHLYWTHLPFCWAALCILPTLAALLLRSRKLLVAATAFFLGILLHLFLDTPMGGIAWAWPWSGTLHSWIVVPARHGWWVWNFLLHWTFAVEVLLCLAAGVVFLRRRRRSRAADGPRRGTPTGPSETDPGLRPAAFRRLTPARRTSSPPSRRENPGAPRRRASRWPRGGSRG